jgi:hypothetical protein
MDGRWIADARWGIDHARIKSQPFIWDPMDLVHSGSQHLRSNHSPRFLIERPSKEYPLGLGVLLKSPRILMESTRNPVNSSRSRREIVI